MQQPKALFSYRPYWAKRFGTASQLPCTREEMDDLGWDSCDIILVTGDAYVDHPSFGMAVIGRVLEAQGFRVGIIAQPDWTGVDDFARLGRPNLFWGVTAGNMDSMVNRYTSDRKVRSDDAYTPDGEGGSRPDRSVLVYAQRCREVFSDVPLIIGGIEASLRRIAHYDYWSDTVRRSVLLDAKADLLVYGNGERQIVEIAHRLASGEPVDQLQDIRGTGFVISSLPEGWVEIDSQTIDSPGKVEPHSSPYASQTDSKPCDTATAVDGEVTVHVLRRPQIDRERSFIRMPSYESVKKDEVLYAHASRVMHLETNPGNARVIVQRHGKRDVWLNPPPIPLATKELDRVFELPYTRQPHTMYNNARIPAYEMIRFSVNIMRGCFGGCTFC
ncbi:MAG TPA: YgiQ family radical SAM protein, partial [Gammaproteobacteria bacterium]|nr:YgiQ family radical SAM protein [Gammaproteobacteria bacterium]